MAFGTLYEESQRCLFETILPQARRLIDQVAVPGVDSIEALPPAPSLGDILGIVNAQDLALCIALATMPASAPPVPPNAMQPIDALFGPDPLAAHHALDALRGEPPSTIEQVLPLPEGRGTRGPASDLRLAILARNWGESIVPHLERGLRHGSWAARLACAPCFGGLRGSRAAEQVLVAALENAGDFDMERMAIESMGWLAADGYAWDVDHHARTGRWRRYEHERANEIYTYAYGKLWSYGVQALARMAAQAREPLRVATLLSLLEEALQRQMLEIPNVGPDGVQLVERVAHLFNERQLDALMERAQVAANDRLRCLYLSLIGNIAPVRAARFLLAQATSPHASARVRSAASIALGEIRVAEVATLVSQTLRSGGGEHEALGWAASTLYATGGSWDDAPDFYAALASGSEETAVQLRYALAVRGDRRCLDQLMADLDHPQPYGRWPAALSLVRLLGPEARVHLRHRVDDAGEDLERAGMLAALVRAGDHARADELHLTLQRLRDLHHLRGVWRMEIIDALRCAPGGQARFEAWCTEALLHERHRRYFDEWGRSSARASGGEMLPALSPVPTSRAATTNSKPTTAGASAVPAKVFISYSHRDAVWLKRFQDMKAPLQRAGKLDPWDDTRMQPGLWQPQIEVAMQDADAALFLVSSHLLSSEFVTRNELPTLLALATARRLRVVWVLLDNCFWEETALAGYQGINAERPLAKMRSADRADVIKKAWELLLAPA